MANIVTQRKRVQAKAEAEVNDDGRYKNNDTGGNAGNGIDMLHTVNTHISTCIEYGEGVDPINCIVMRVLV